MQPLISGLVRPKVRTEAGVRALARAMVFSAALALMQAAPASAQAVCENGAECGVMDRLGQLLGRLDPWFTDLAQMLGDVSGWHAPEILPNGDILIRRRQPGDETDEAEEAEDAPVTDPVEL